MPDLDREGIFRVHAKEWTLRENEKTGSVNLSVKFAVLEQYMGEGQWHSWAEYDPYEVWGTYNIIKKNGELNETTVKQLIEGIGWDANLDQFTNESYQLHDCQVSVKNEVYDGKSSFRAGWMNAFDHVPQAQGIDEERVGSLQAKYGGQLRAIASNANRQPKPNGAPQTPPPVEAATAAQRPVGPDGDEIPF